MVGLIGADNLRTPYAGAAVFDAAADAFFGADALREEIFFATAFVLADVAVDLRLADAFLAGGVADVFARVFLLTALPFKAAFDLVALSETVEPESIKNLFRSFAEASHAGAGPRPLHVAPDLGSRYFAGSGVRFAFPLVVTRLSFADGIPVLSIRNLVRSFTSLIQAGGRA